MMDQKAYRRERGRSRNSNMVINPEMAAILKRRNLTSRMALKCVSVGTGPEGKKNVLARCSVVNYDGEVIFDKFVKSPEPITAFRTNVSGIKPNDIRDDNAISYQEVQSSMRILLKDRVVIGHCVDVDLHAMLLHHPAKMLRDCATCVLLCPEAPIPLVDLIKTRLNMDVPSGPDAVQEARHCMLLYRTFEEAWETSLNVLSAKTPRGSGREPRRNATR
jgi:DNA polymerase III epsilon subunit-like protein